MIYKKKYNIIKYDFIFLEFIFDILLKIRARFMSNLITEFVIRNLYIIYK